MWEMYTWWLDQREYTCINKYEKANDEVAKNALNKERIWYGLLCFVTKPFKFYTLILQTGGSNCYSFMNAILNAWLHNCYPFMNAILNAWLHDCIIAIHLLIWMPY